MAIAPTIDPTTTLYLLCMASPPAGMIGELEAAVERHSLRAAPVAQAGARAETLTRGFFGFHEFARLWKKFTGARFHSSCPAQVERSSNELPGRRVNGPGRGPNRWRIRTWKPSPAR